MGNFSAKNLEVWTSGKWKDGRLPASINRIQFNSKLIQKGDLFIALTTGERDGHSFVESAFSNGASGVIVSNPSPHPFPQLIVDDTLGALQEIGAMNREAFNGEVIGITGSFGKTSTKDLLHLLLGEGYYATLGNLNNYIGVPLSLSELNDNSYTGAIIEAGINQRGEMVMLGGMIKPTQIIITGIGNAHLEALGNLKNIAEEKTELIRQAKKADEAQAYFHADCLKYEVFNHLKIKKSYLFISDNDSLPKNLGGSGPCQSFQLIRYVLELGKGNLPERLVYLSDELNKTPIQLPPMSNGMAKNAVIAIYVALMNGVELSVLQDRLNQWSPDSLRGSIKTIDNRPYFVDCYNANPDSVRDSLQYFRNLYPNQSRLLVLASMNELGPEACELHYSLAKELKLDTLERILLVGEYADDLERGFLDSGAASESIKRLTSLNLDEPWLNKDKVPVYLKGSRSYQLEKILNPKVEN